MKAKKDWDAIKERAAQFHGSPSVRIVERVHMVHQTHKKTTLYPSPKLYDHTTLVNGTSDSLLKR